MERELLLLLSKRVSFRLTKVITAENDSVYAQWEINKTYVLGNDSIMGFYVYAPSYSFTWINVSATSIYQCLNVPDDPGWFVTSYARSNALVDLTNYCKLYITYVSSTGGSIAGIGTSSSSSPNSKSIALSATSGRTVCIDISSCIGSYYIYAVYGSESYAGNNIRCTVTSIWLE